MVHPGPFTADDLLPYRTAEQRFPEEPKHLQDKDLRVHYFAKNHYLGTFQT